MHEEKKNYFIKEKKQWLIGKTFIVTGANRGFGYEVTKHLVERHANVVMACRDSNGASEAISKIRVRSATGNLHFVPLDLTSFESIVNFAAIIKRTYPTIYCIINNAAVKVKTNDYSKENVEINFATNYLGHFILVQILKEYIEQNCTKIVMVGSRSHHKGRIDFDNLGKCIEPKAPSPKYYHRNSKLAILYFAGELYRRGFDVHVTCPDDEYTELFKDKKMKRHDYVLNYHALEETVQNIVYCATENENTEQKNPLNGYFMKNRKHFKSKVFYSELDSKQLWDETIKKYMCNPVLTRSLILVPQNNYK